ncbi:C-type lectin domain family 4 member M-like [Amphiprion ocellaris]|uniref:C-type lectin domain family 4 member M-like n=1 Tax=Amphiprion ocellaris TaxID=80972 RepID=UPI002410C6CE|nr:C-type lectin domain family 4 member M-like [Amphiprion ocellaris]
MALRIHFTSVISAKLSDEVKTSDDAYQNLLDATKENENLTMHHSNLEVQIDTLRWINSVLWNNITILTEENYQMMQENHTLWAKMQQIKEQINQMKTEIQKLRAENQQLRGYQVTTPGPNWTYSKVYVRKKRQTEPCQAGWLHFQSKCYLICSRDSPDQKTWQAARDDCREKDADLVVIQSPEEQDFICSSSAAGFGVDGFWISLRVEGGSWKWLNGNDLTENYWIRPPADNQNCAIAVKDTRGWRAESCDVRNEWVCEKDALPN